MKFSLSTVAFAVMAAASVAVADKEKNTNLRSNNMMKESAVARNGGKAAAGQKAEKSNQRRSLQDPAGGVKKGAHHAATGPAALMNHEGTQNRAKVQQMHHTKAQVHHATTDPAALMNHHGTQKANTNVSPHHKTASTPYQASNGDVVLTISDVPGWYDSDGPQYDCMWYMESPENCNLFGYDYELFGLTTIQACTACGGGLREYAAGYCKVGQGQHEVSVDCDYPLGMTNPSSVGAKKVQHAGQKTDTVPAGHHKVVAQKANTNARPAASYEPAFVDADPDKINYYVHNYCTSDEFQLIIEYKADLFAAHDSTVIKLWSADWGYFHAQSMADCPNTSPNDGNACYYDICLPYGAYTLDIIEDGNIADGLFEGYVYADAYAGFTDNFLGAVVDATHENINAGFHEYVFAV